MFPLDGNANFYPFDRHKGILWIFRDDSRQPESKAGTVEYRAGGTRNLAWPPDQQVVFGEASAG